MRGEDAGAFFRGLRRVERAVGVVVGGGGGVMGAGWHCLEDLRGGGPDEEG